MHSQYLHMGTLALVLSATLAHAGDYTSPTNDRVRISLGIMRVSASTDLRVDSSAGLPGTNINAEKQFGLQGSLFEPKFQAMVRAGTRHRLRFDYFTLDRTGNTTIGAAPILFRDVVLQPGDPVNTKLSLRTLGIAYGYSFWHSEKLEIAAVFGVNSTDISANARVQVLNPARPVNQSEDHAGPVPTLGIDATWVASRRFYLDGRAQYLNVHVNSLDGSLGFYELDALYRFRPNVSFAIGYTEVRANLTSTKPTQSGVFGFNAKGPELFVRVAF